MTSADVMSQERKKKSNRRCGHGHVFDDPEKKNQMLAYRVLGYSYVQLAYYYGVDHTTILYHCKKANLPYFAHDDGTKRKSILLMLKEGLTLRKIAKIFKVPETTLTAFCARAGIKGIKIKENKKLKLVLKLPIPISRRSRYGPGRISYKYTPPNPRPGWIDKGGIWYKKEKSIYQLNKEQKQREKKKWEEGKSKLLEF